MTQLTKYTNNDVASTIFFARELEAIKPGSYDVEYAPLSAFKLIPVSRTTDAGAEVVTYTQYDSTGRSKIIANYADDVPLVNVKGQQFSSNIVSLGDGYLISIQDMRASRFANKNIEQRLIQTANEAIQQDMNELAFFGDSHAGVQGWLTNTSIDSAPVAGATAPDRLWSGKTGPEMVDDLNNAVADIITDTKGREMPDTVAMPIGQYLRLQKTQYAPGTDTTALQFFLENNQGMTVIAANELQGAFGGLDGFVVYTRSERKFWQEVPVAFEMLPPQRDNLAYKVICHARYGGVIVAYPQSQVFRTGI